jgi:long-chain acyl-CoA synthetase
MENFCERFISTARRFPERPAVAVQRRDAVDRFTYGELSRMAQATAAKLAGQGIGRGDRCAILADNDAHWCAAYLGTLLLGGVAVPLDTAYKAKQVAALVADCGARALFTTPRYLTIAEEAARASGAPCEILSLHEFVAPGPAPAAFETCPAMPEDQAVILYTSGTTSDPKGVVLTHANLLAEAEAVFRVVHIDEQDVVLGVLPLFHALAQMANLLLPFAVGASVVFLEQLNTTELLRALRERGVTAFACVPQFFYLIHQRVTEQMAQAGWAKRGLFRALLRLNGALRRSLGVNLGPVVFGRVHAVLGRKMRILVTGGSRFDPRIGQDLYGLGFNILQAYGLTECSGAATLTHPGDARVDAVGPPLPGVEVRILPPEKAEADGARDGEILLRGGIVMEGYFRRPEVNAATLRDGWLHTGDLGYLDAAGRLYVTGRKKEVIVLSSGKNIYPEEIEAHYQQSPFIKELCVMGLSRPDEPAAERLHAVVVPNFDLLRERKVVNAGEILRFEIESLSIQLPGHKRILSYDVWTEELPRTTTRKLKRFAIERRVREQAQAAAAEAAGAAPREEDLAWAADAHVARALEVVREAARKKDAVRPDANIELDLGLDSMERVELLTHLEQLTGVEVPDEAAHRIYTVRELVEAVRPAGGAAAEGGARGDAWARLLAETPEDDPVLRELLRPKPVVAAFAFAVVRALGLLAWLAGLRVAGREHLPRSGAFLLCPNHQSYLDAFLLVSALPFRIFRNLFFVGASEYFETPLRRRLASLLNVVPVDPDTNLLRAMQAGAYGLRHGKVLILFPEGERSIDGTVKKFKKGAAILSTHLGAPVVPVALDGVFEVWPRGRAFRLRACLPGRGSRMRMRFGPPLPPPGAPAAGASLAEAEAHYSAATERLRRAVVEMWEALRPPATARA